MDVNAPLALLGGLSPAVFMRRYRQNKPLLVRQAGPAVVPPLPRRETFALATSDDVELRLVVRERALGESLTEPKPRVWFGRHPPDHGAGGVRLDARSRMMYGPRHVYINGEAFAAGGRDARLMRQLADTRQRPAADRKRLGPAAAALPAEWVDAGWLHGDPA